MKLQDLIYSLQQINSKYDCETSEVVNIYLNYQKQSDPADGHHGVVVGFRGKPGQDCIEDIYEIVA